MISLQELDNLLIANLKRIAISSKSLSEFLMGISTVLQNHFKLKYISIYLCIKEPCLQLFYRLDSNGKCIGEIGSAIKYSSGQGLVGKLFDDQMRCSMTYTYSDNISKMEIGNFLLSNIDYIPERNILAIPLVSQNRIIGAIEFLDAGTDFNESYDYIISAYIASQVVSRAIGSLFRGEVIKVIEALSNMEIAVLNRKLCKDEYLQKVANLITENELINYYVSIIRIFSKYKPGIKDEFISYTPDIDNSRYKKISYSSTSGFSRICFDTANTIKIDSINKNNISKFNNSEWIQDNRLKAYICIPIVFSGKPIGTLSLFVRYTYHFYNSDYLFLNLLSHSIGKTIGLEERMEQVRKEVTENTRATARELSDLVSIKEFTHAYKNDIRTIKDTIEKVISTLPKSRTTGLNKLHESLNQRESELDNLIRNTRGEYGAKITFSINNLLDEIVSHFNSEIELEGVNVIKEYAVIPDVSMDKNRLLEAISNIFHNAIKSFKGLSPRFNKEIFLSTFIDSNTDEYCIVIMDNGCGIESKLLSNGKLFDEGFTGFKNQDGTGQGLFYSASILDSFGGEINVDSRVGMGSTFTVRFPKNVFES